MKLKKGISVEIVSLRGSGYAVGNSQESEGPAATGTLIEDAEGRDLTINSLYWNLHTRKVEDPTGKGLSDLRSGILRTPRDPTETLAADPLRSLRVFRFLGRFRFRLDETLHRQLEEPLVKVRRESLTSEMVEGRNYAGANDVGDVEVDCRFRRMECVVSLGISLCHIWSSRRCLGFLGRE